MTLRFSPRTLCQIDGLMPCKKRKQQVELARAAVEKLRDATREGRVIEFRQRDPLVMAIHDALDLVNVDA